MNSEDAVATAAVEYHTGITTRDRIKEFIKEKQQKCGHSFDSPFFLGDLEMIKRQYMTWRTCLPRVEVFYAVKACAELPVLKLLTDMGVSFHCASQREIEIMLKLGVDPSRIICANTVKFISCLQYAFENKVSLMTFDNEEELKKIKKFYPEARTVLRIRCADSLKVEVNFGMKYGCSMYNVPQLLNKARCLDMTVVGVSFHVGSGTSEPALFTKAIKDAHAVFQIGKSTGFSFNLLDIGGGFLGHNESHITFQKIAAEINACLDEYFPENSDVRIIAEPGQFLVTTAFTWVIKIIGKRSNETMEEGILYERNQPKTVTPRFLYYVNDGIHGFMPEDIASLPKIRIFNQKGLNSTAAYSSVVFGPTCSGLDVVYSDISLPELNIGDWLYLENAGAYSMVLASDFNMVPRAQYCYITDTLDNED